MALRTEAEPQVINSQQKCRQAERNERLQWQPLSSNEANNTKPVSQQQQQQPKFEAYMMTGEHILNISRIPQTTAAILPKQQKKADNPRYHNSHTHHMRGAPPPFTQHNSLPNSPNERDLGHRGAGGVPVGGRHSAAASPVVTARRAVAAAATEHQQAGTAPPGGQQPPPGTADGYNYVRTSRSEDQLQGQNDLCSGRRCDQLPEYPVGHPA
nr:unnamed protein product [Callosobruchus chinensis]